MTLSHGSSSMPVPMVLPAEAFAVATETPVPFKIVVPLAVEQVVLVVAVLSASHSSNFGEESGLFGLARKAPG